MSIPQTEADTEVAKRFLESGELRMQRCSACGQLRHPARWLCPRCLVAEHTWEQLAGTGSIYSFIWYLEALDARYAEVPYNVVVAELDEGPRMVSTVVDVQFDQLAVGARVRAEVARSRWTNQPVVTFRLADPDEKMEKAIVA